VINYRHGLGTSFLIAIACGLMFGILAYLFGILIGTDIPAMHIAESAKGIERGKSFMREEMYEQAMLALEEMKGNPYYALFRIMLSDFGGKIIGGFLVSLLVAAFMKKSANPFSEKML